MKIDYILISLGSFLMGTALGLCFCDDSEEETRIEPSHDELRAMVKETFASVNKAHKYDLDNEETNKYQKIVHESEYTNVDDEDDEVVPSYSEEMIVKEDGTKLVGTEYGEERDDGPYIISADSFMNEYLDFDKETLIWYEEDEILCDDRSEPIDYVERTIGSEALSSFGMESGREDIVYVRNLSMCCDFEVSREHASYSDMVLGYPSEEEYRRARRNLGLDEDGEEQ